jgi:hypothetical protein
MRFGLAWRLTTRRVGLFGNRSRTVRPWSVLAGRKRDRLRETVACPTQGYCPKGLPDGTINQHRIALSGPLAV